jgi:excisionase family DNA binding protein
MTITNKPLMLTLTINATAERVGLSAYIICKWAKNGTIRAVRAGNKIYINNDSLDDYLNAHSLTDTVEEQVSGLRPIPVKIGGAV